MRLLRTLHGRIFATFVAILAVMVLVAMSLIVTTTRHYLQAVDQSLNRGLARQILAETGLAAATSRDVRSVAPLFARVMALNPLVEVYLLDAGGAVVAHSLAPAQLVRQRVDLAPLRLLADGSATLPLLGDDPRASSQRKVFSVAPFGGEVPAGYVYVILGGETYDSVLAMLAGHHLLRLSLGLTVAGLAVAVTTGFVAFYGLTRRLRRLIAALQGVGCEAVVVPQVAAPARVRDEIDELAAAVAAMTRRIDDQMAVITRGESARREMIESVSHDLRTPLTVLEGTLELMLAREVSMSPDERRSRVEQALKQAERLRRLIDELFELATLEAADRPLAIEPFALDELVQDVVQKFEPAAEQKAIRLDLTLVQVPFVEAELRLIERVLENLIDNAVKFTPAGGRVRVSLALEAGRAVARVADSGPGVAAAERARIGERFYRAASTDQAEGAGLGLAIARRILELHHSRLEVASAQGRGSVFAFALPTSAHASVTSGRLS